MEASGIPSGSHAPLSSSSGGPNITFVAHGSVSVAAASSASESNQFSDATAAQAIAPLVTTIDVSPPPSSKTKEVFEFTKRKRWADLLIAELTEAIILVLSQDGTVSYCGNAVYDLLGWRDEEVVDKKFTEIMNGEFRLLDSLYRRLVGLTFCNYSLDRLCSVLEEDHAMFQSMFSDSIQQKSEMESYARLQCKTTQLFPIIATPGNVRQFVAPPPKEILFEIKGYPHFLPETDEFKCFFAVAKPYPSGKTAKSVLLFKISVYVDLDLIATFPLG